MVKEYISKLQEENREKIRELDQEIMELSSQLESSEQLLAEIQQEKSLDKSIFSPRDVDTQRDKKIEEKQQEIEQLRQHLDYAGQMREAEIQNCREYQALADEIEHGFEEKERGDEISRGNFDQFYEHEHGEPTSSPDVSVSAEELLSFLNSSCNKIEYSLSLVGGNKNRCKSELRSLLKMTRSYIHKLEGST